MARRGHPRRLRAVALALGLACALATSAGAASIDVVPEPLSVQVPTNAGPTVIGPGARISVPAGDRGALAAARYLAGLMHETRGLALAVRTGAPGPGGIAFVRAGAPDLGPEGYRLDIGAGRVRVTAATDAGFFYGAVTLWQLASPGRGAVRLAAVRIEDRPRFAWRGLLLDSARHYQSPAFVERLIGWMALHKLNVLEWHLTDDQAWRLQIARYPRLTSVGAWRSAGVDPASGRPIQYGGFYTKAEVRRIVAFAAVRHVAIVPEIEMPGHALAAILAYPQLGSGPPPPPSLRSDWGVFPYLFSPTSETLGFLDNVLSEVMAMFPSRYIAIGGDEAVKDEWRASPQVQAEIKALGLSGPDALQGWFTDRIASFLAAHGRRAIGWDDILAGGSLPADAAVLSWHLGGALAAARQDHDAVIATDPVLYFDHRQSDLPSEPPGRGAVVSLRDVYLTEPAPPTLAPAERAHVIGVQANLWTEHVPTEADLEKMAFPRAAALAEVAWSAPGRKDWAGFLARLPDELARERSVGLAPDDGALRVKLDETPAAAGSALAVSLSNQLGLGQIRYTLDGAAPTARSPSYQAPIPVRAALRLRAATFEGERQLAPGLDETIDPAGPQRRVSQQLASCSSKLVLNLAPATPLQGRHPFLVDIMDPCWILPQADLRHAASLAVAVTHLPFNFQLGADLAKLVRPAPKLAGGELDVRADGCAGPLVARFSLAAATRDPGLTTLEAPIPPRAGRHDLCLSFATGKVDPLWVIDWVQVGSAAPGSGRAP
ncbi:MAG TPA: family 20 glycosylhydrolase [Caulobacteraceae bacterium]|nr:family 20 glycosylhydrolase [Caulobacteraceae bacterium]